ncbi:Release factor glutamine methyltransferase [Tsukamurella paurometabola]
MREIEAALGGTVDLVVCNPPYVPDGAPLDVEAALDPAAALFSGPDGLDLIRSLAPLCTRLLRTGGAVAIEHDDSNGAAAAELLAAAGFRDVEQHRDLAGDPGTRLQDGTRAASRTTAPTPTPGPPASPRREPRSRVATSW